MVSWEFAKMFNWRTATSLTFKVTEFEEYIDDIKV